MIIHKAAMLSPKATAQSALPMVPPSSALKPRQIHWLSSLNLCAVAEPSSYKRMLVSLSSGRAWMNAALHADF